MINGSFKSYSYEDTLAIGERIAKELTGKEVIALFGGLGMGKTALTTGIVNGLGAEHCVSSPTFAIVNEYHAKFTIYHFDMYRISDWDDLYSVGFFDYLDNGVLVIEWSENMEEFLPDDCVRITLTKTDNENERLIDISGFDYENTIN